MILSEHFTLDEMIFSQTAARHNIDNMPPREAIERLEDLCETILEPIRSQFKVPIRVSSGYRGMELNRIIGGSQNSQHMDGEAADIILHGIRPLTVCGWVLQSSLPFHQVIHEFGRWTHVSIAPKGREPRRQALTIDRHGTRSGLFEAR